MGKITDVDRPDSLALIEKLGQAIIDMTNAKVDSGEVTPAEVYQACLHAAAATLAMNVDPDQRARGCLGVQLSFAELVRKYAVAFNPATPKPN